MKNIFTKIIILLLLCTFPATVFAQTDCSLELKQALELYEKGMYQQSADILNRNLKKCNYTGAEHELAIKTLISANCELDELESAHQLAYNFLKENPIYKAYSTDPLPFANELNRFTVSPKVTITINGGVNLFIPRVTSRYSVWDAADYNQAYQLSTGHVYAIGAEYIFNENISISTSFDYQSHNFSRTIPVSGKRQINYSETYSDFRNPIMLNYSFPLQKKWYPSLYAGIYGSNIVIAQATMSVADSAGVGLGTMKDLSIKENRNVINFGILAGAKLNYTYKRYIFSLNFSYSLDTKNYTKTSQTNNTILYDYYYIDDDIRTQSVALTFGITYNLFYNIKSKY